MNASWLPLFVALPLLASALSAALPQRAARLLLLLGTPLATAAAGMALIGIHRETPVLATSVGGFPAGIAIPFVSDSLSAVLLTVTGIATFVVLLFALRTGEDRLRFFPALVLMLVAGVNGAFLTGDIFNLFVFVEVMLLPSYALLAMSGTWRRLGVGRLFLVVNLVTSSVFLIGIGLLYAAAGTVNLAALVGRGAEPDVALGAAVVLLALVVKAGAVPVHGWLPRSYPATSATVMALFGSLHSKVALVAVYRINAVVFGESRVLVPAFVVLVVLSVVFGAWSSIGENTMRRILSFQLVSSTGHILIAVALLSLAGYRGGLIYLVHSVLTLGALVLAAGAVEQTYGTGHLVRLADLLRREKALAWIVGLALISVVGFPPSAGFVGKVALVVASAAATPWVAGVLISAVILGSILTLVAMQRLWHDVFWGPKMTLYRLRRPPAARSDESKDDLVPLPDSVRIPALDLVPAALMLVLSLALFAGAGPAWEIATRAAQGLVDVAPYVEAVMAR
jgi:multicomponent Na+:H+ antiporter subunit D